jgi:putative heme-binding domain-containing protein
MHFPKDAVLGRTISLGARRLETQLLHYDGLDWRAYTYAWREDQVDADLVPAEGAEMEVRVGEQSRLWQFHSRTQCMSCHSNQSEYALAFVPEQLNRAGRDGRNQLVSFTEAGYIHRADNDDKPLPPFDADSAAQERKVADPTDKNQPLEARARGYLHGNCAHCHSDHGGGAVPLRLAFFTPPDRMQAIGVRPTRGDFALPEAAIVKPGDPFASTLYFRMAKFGRDRMPHLGAELPDEAGLNLVEHWIAGMSGEAATSEASLTGAAFDESLADHKTALRLARALAQGEFDGPERDVLLAAAAKLASGPVRDLFEGYLPANEKGERKLGTNPRPKMILALRGDSAHGESLFLSQAVNCGKCHRIGERGAAVGPDLSAIGTLRSPEDLLDSLLAPSRRIEPKFASYVIQTVDGRSFTGVVIQRDEKSIVLRDGEGKEIILSAKDVETLRPSLTSLMPDGQMAGLTAQEAADLLEYLATQREVSGE